MYNEWPMLFQDGCNWYDFSIVRFDMEKCNMSGVFITQLAIMGIGISIVYIFDRKKIDDIMKV